MDLHDFEGQELYFNEQLPDELSDLIESASESYGTSEAEQSLLKAFFLAPDNLSVLVALYRYYYYQHQYEKALVIAGHALNFSGRRVDFPEKWRDLTQAHVANGALQSMGMVRFYLLALKAAGYINLRIHQFSTASDMLNKVVELDSSDRLGATALLAVAVDYLNKERTAPVHAIPE